MNKKIWIIIFSIIIIIALIWGISSMFNSSILKKQTSNYEASKTESDVNASNTQENKQNQDNSSSNNSTQNENSNKENNITNNNKTENKTENTTPEQSKTPPQTETQLSTFTTKIYTKDSGRQNNIGITCKTLNNTIVENGATFSFCGTVGQATTAKGYKKADIFDANRK